MPEEKHISENRIVSTPGTYSIFGTKENTKPPEINALSLDAVIGNFRILAVNEHPSKYSHTIISPIASGDWWTLYSNGLLDIYCVGDMPPKVDDINSWARNHRPWLDYVSQINRVVIHDSVTNIEACAFSDCENLTDVVIPQSVTRIRYSAFLRCSELTSIIIPDGVTSIEDDTFYHCSELTSIIIPDGVTDIGMCSFEFCYSLISITIPDSVTNIKSYAFWDCSALTDVYYGGTDVQWNAITRGIYNTPLTRATIHYNSTGST